MSIISHLFKGIAHIFGSLALLATAHPALKKCSLLSGVGEIVSAFGDIILLIFSIYRSILPIASNNLGMLITPEKFSKLCENFYGITEEEINTRIEERTRGDPNQKAKMDEGISSGDIGWLGAKNQHEKFKKELKATYDFKKPVVNWLFT